MADEAPIDRLVRDFVTRLQDLNLPTSRDMQGFVGELKAIKESIDSLSLSTTAGVEAQNRLAKHYEGGSASASASIPREGTVLSSTPLKPLATSGAGGPSVPEDVPDDTGPRGPLGSMLQNLQSRFQDPDPEDAADHRLKMPQIGEFTTQNALEWLSDVSRHQGHTATSNFLNSASQKVAQLALVRQYASQHGYETRIHTLEGTGGFQGRGAELGATGGGDISLGPLGFRVPFLDPQFQKGLSDEFQRYGLAAQAGINKTQANTIFNNLNELGWLGGDRTNQMRSAAGQIMRYNTQLGNNPEIYQAMDKATRLGTQSLKEFVAIVKTIPDAAKAAHVSMEQIVQDGNAIGQISEQQGGTAAHGFGLAPILAQATGLDPGMFAQGFENPLVQSYAFRKSGLPPWMQDLQSPYQRIQSVFGAINEMRGATTFSGNRTSSLGGLAGKYGFTQQISSADMQAAQLHQLFPEYGAAALKKMLNPNYQKRVSAGVEVLGAASSWSDSVRRKQQQGHDTKSMFDLRGGHHGDLGDLLNMAHMAVDSNGNPIFSKAEIAKIKNLARPTAHMVAGEKGHLVGGGRNSKWVPATKAHMEGTTAAQAASKAYGEMKKVWDKKTGSLADQNAPKVTIDLSPAARKLFGIKADTNKDKANAGQATVNIPSAIGPTQVPMYGGSGG